MNWQRTKQHLLGGLGATGLLIAAVFGTDALQQRASAYGLPDLSLPHHKPVTVNFHITPLDRIEKADDETAMFIFHYMSNNLMLGDRDGN